MKREYYYDVTIHYGIVNNSCRSTIERSFGSLEEAIKYAEMHWNRPLKVVQPNLDGSCDIVRDFIEKDGDDEWDLIVITRMREL